MRISKDPEIRRQEIIAAAGNLFQSQGITKTSINEIAERMGVAKGLVYYYFASKDKLVEAVIEDFTAKLNASLTRIQKRPELDFYGKLKAVLDLYFHAIQSHPTILTFTPADPTAYALLKEKLSDIAFEQVKPILRTGLEQGLISIKYPEYVLKVLIRGLGDLYIEGVRNPDVHTILIEQTLGLEMGSL